MWLHYSEKRHEIPRTEAWEAYDRLVETGNRSLYIYSQSRISRSVVRTSGQIRRQPGLVIVSITFWIQPPVSTASSLPLDPRLLPQG